MSDNIIGEKAAPLPLRYTAHGFQQFVVYQPNAFGVGPVKQEYHHTDCQHPLILRWHAGSHPVAWIHVTPDQPRVAAEKMACILAAAPQLFDFVKEVWANPDLGSRHSRKAFELLNGIPFKEAA